MARKRSSSPVRIGVIGMGIMGAAHAEDLQSGRVKRARLAAVCDAMPANLDKVTGPRKFSDPHDLICSGEVDAVVIATPHYSHTTIGIDALENGLHVMVEKPISAHKADAERLIAAHRGRRQVFAGMFNLRTVALYRRLKAMIEAGELGTLSRIQWTITDWFRSECYYSSASWRGTWAGEGGGVLINQCPHQLDIMQWFFGMPSRVWGFCKFGGRHAIEVEDEVTAYLEYPNGATGVFITSTGEAPGTSRLEIAGSLGRIVSEDNRLILTRNAVAADKFSRTTCEKFKKPPARCIEIHVPDKGGEHALLVKNFVDAILDGTALFAPAEEGIRSIELANAMVYSTWTGKPVTLPLDGRAYEVLLKKRIVESAKAKKRRHGAK